MSLINSILPPPPPPPPGDVVVFAVQGEGLDRIGTYGGLESLPERQGIASPADAAAKFAPATPAAAGPAWYRSAILLDPTDGVIGTGADVDSWETATAGAFTATAQGGTRPQLVGAVVEMRNSGGGVNHFLAGSTATFQRITEVGRFALGWRGTVDGFQTAVSGIDAQLLATRSSGRGVELEFTSSGGTMSFVVSNAAGSTLWSIDDTTFGAGYTLGDTFDVVIIGTGDKARMYLDGVQVGSEATVATEAGAHELQPRIGKATAGANYHDGDVAGLFYDELRFWSFDHVAEIRSYLT